MKEPIYRTRNFLFTALILILIQSCIPDFGEYFNHDDLKSQGRNFSDVYRSRKDINEFRTDGYYYQLDSVDVYKMLIYNKPVYRYKSVVDEYRKSPNWKKEFLGSYSAYFFRYFVINKSGLCYIGTMSGATTDFDEPFYLVTDNKSIKLDSIINIIKMQIDKDWDSDRLIRWEGKRYYKGAVEKVNDKFAAYYFMGQMELPDFLNKFEISVINDTNLTQLTAYQS